MMPARALNRIADLICRAQRSDRTPMGIALALDSAGVLTSPETAAEVARLRERVAELEARPAESWEWHDPANGACTECGEGPEKWCPDCAGCACPDGRAESHTPGGSCPRYATEGGGDRG